MNTNSNSHIYIIFISLLLTLITIQQLLAGTATQVRYFDTYSGGIFLSTDPAGITYYRGHLFIVDSEIDETGPPPPPGYFVGYNFFETSLDGNTVFGEYLLAPSTGSIEPTGICYNPTDGYFYNTNDNTKKLYQYELNDSLSLIKSWDLRQALFDTTEYRVEDPEGIAVNPITGHLYIVEGKNRFESGPKILIVEVNGNSISLVDSFSVADKIIDPEGIAFHENTGHLFMVSGPDNKVFEYDVAGNYIDEYDISGFNPSPRSAQGLTFAPNSTDNSRLSLYIADGGMDESPDRARIYEADLGDDISMSVGLFSFKALVTNGIVKLEWETVSEHENIIWSLEKRTQNSDEFLEIARLDRMAGSGQGRIYEYYDSDVLPGKTYFYRLWDIDSIGFASPHQVISVSLSPPESFYLAQNYPNPFNPGTTIEFDLPEDAHVKIDLFNTLGQFVQTLTNEQLEAGHYQVEFNGQNLSSGVYFYRIEAGDFHDVKRMILIK